MKEILSSILPIMVEAKKILSNNDIRSEEKTGIGNIVTSTDKQLESLIKNTLQEKFPESQIISEESAEDTVYERKNGLKFIVDPLDGTTNYTNGWPHTIAIGVADNDELIGGVVYDVLSDKVYCGIKGKGVYYCDIDDIANLKPVVQPKQQNDKIKKAVISYDTPYGAEAFETTREMINNLYYAGASLKTVGPISLDVLKTALGRENRPTDYNNAVWHTEVRAWDLAAATAILRELGGEIIGSDGKPLSIDVLTSPTAKISFIASGNKTMLKNLYAMYPQKKRKLEEEVR